MTKIKRIILITGTPGVGKTTVSIKLSCRLEAYLLEINKFVKEKNMAIGIDTERNSIIADLEKLSKTVKNIIHSTSKNVIIEGHYVQYVVPKDLVSQIFVLRRDPDDLKKVLEERGFDEKKVAENIVAEILDTCLQEAVEEYDVQQISEINTTNKTVDEIVDEISRVLDGKERLTIGTVDWIGKLENEGRLEKFLK